MKQIQYFMAEDKTQRIASFTLWLEEGEEVGKLTFSQRGTSDDVWGPPKEIKQGGNSVGKDESVKLSEAQVDWFTETQGFTVKEVIE